MNRCVIIGGAKIADYGRIRRALRKDDFFVCCDSGLTHAEYLGISPSLIVGDFDSHPRPDTSTETITLPRAKDDTDTVFAAKEAVRRGFHEFLLIGVTGERFDHTFVNVSLLLWLDSQRKRAAILDDYAVMEIVSRDAKTVGEEYSYFSLLNISGTAENVTIRGAKFPLEGGTITSEYQYAVSNEVLPGETAVISVGKGRLLLMRVF